MKKIWWVHITALLLIAAITCGPLSLALGAGWVAEANGCTLHEGFVNPCMIGGRDYGETLYGMGMMGWLAIASIPLGLIMLAAYLVIVFIVWLVRRQQSTEPPAKG